MSDSIKSEDISSNISIYVASPKRKISETIVWATFDKIQQLIQSGQKDQATQLVNGLSDSDYTLYKDLKAGSTRSSTTKAEAQFLPTYRSIQKLLQEGNTSQATQLVNKLSDSDYKLSQSLKKKNFQ